MSDYREKLEALCTELKDVQKTLKKAGKSRKKESIAEVRKIINESASRIEKSLATIEPERLCKPGVSKNKFDEMVETSGCYKCNCKSGVVVQWLSPHTGRALKRFSVLCASCWNVLLREQNIRKAIEENNNMNKSFQK